MKRPIYYIDRLTGEKKQEQVYGNIALNILYGKNWVSKSLAFLTANLFFLSKFYGFLQRLPWSKRKIKPFIKKFGLNENEFLVPADQFRCFDDFFTRKLKPGARTIVKQEKIAVIPADGRFLFYSHLSKSDGIIVKGKKFSLSRLIGDSEIAERYKDGSLVLGRLCPVDYHRFHFPFRCLPNIPKLIEGPLYSVNPIAVKQKLSFLIENKRMITELKTDHFGTVFYIEIGATNVGTIHQTFTPFQSYEKGEEKGYFSFGGSSIALLFEPNRIYFDEDLLKGSAEHTETLCKMGQSMGTAKKG